MENCVGWGWQYDNRGRKTWGWGWGEGDEGICVVGRLNAWSCGREKYSIHNQLGQGPVHDLKRTQSKEALWALLRAIELKTHMHTHPHHTHTHTHIQTHTYTHTHTHTHYLSLSLSQQFFSVNLWSTLSQIFVSKSQKHDHEYCPFVSGVQCVWLHEQCWQMWQRFILFLTDKKWTNHGCSQRS